MSTWVEGLTERQRTNLVVGALVAAALSPGMVATAAHTDLRFFHRSPSSLSSCEQVVRDAAYCSHRDDKVYLSRPHR